MDATPISEIMSASVVTVTPDASLSDVLPFFRVRDVPSIIVVRDEVSVGIVSERDLVALLSREGAYVRLESAAVSTVMPAPIHTVRDTDAVSDVAEVIEARGFRRVPVVDEDGKLVGIVAFTDLVGFHIRLLRAQSAALEQVVEDRTRELQAANQRLQLISREDALLAIGNRRAMDEMLDQVHERLRRYGNPYAVLLIDVDNFKPFNDLYGHQTGDEALQKLAARCLAGLRSTDRLYRYGGEELLAVLTETPVEGAMTAAERLRAAVEELGIPHEGSPFGVVTVSVGVCAVGAVGAPPDRWEVVVSTADTALYTAKNEGRNRAVYQPIEQRPDLHARTASPV